MPLNHIPAASSYKRSYTIRGYIIFYILLFICSYKYLWGVLTGLRSQPAGRSRTLSVSSQHATKHKHTSKVDYDCRHTCGLVEPVVCSISLPATSRHPLPLHLTPPCSYLYNKVPYPSSDRPNKVELCGENQCLLYHNKCLHRDGRSPGPHGRSDSRASPTVPIW